MVKNTIFCHSFKKKSAKSIANLKIMRTFASVIAKRIQNDSLAQLVEQLTLNQWVEGSNPSGVTKDDESRPYFVSIPHPHALSKARCPPTVKGSSDFPGWR